MRWSGGSKVGSQAPNVVVVERITIAAYTKRRNVLRNTELGLTADACQMSGRRQGAPRQSADVAAEPSSSSLGLGLRQSGCLAFTGTVAPTASAPGRHPSKQATRKNAARLRLGDPNAKSTAAGKPAEGTAMPGSARRSRCGAGAAAATRRCRRHTRCCAGAGRAGSSDYQLPVQEVRG